VKTRRTTATAEVVTSRGEPFGEHGSRDVEEVERTSDQLDEGESEGINHEAGTALQKIFYVFGESVFSISKDHRKHCLMSVEKKSVKKEGTTTSCWQRQIDKHLTVSVNIRFFRSFMTQRS